MLQGTSSSGYMPNQETYVGGVTTPIPSGTAGCQPASGCCPNCGRCPHCGQTPVNPPQVPYYLPAYWPPYVGPDGITWIIPANINGAVSALTVPPTNDTAYESYLKYDTVPPTNDTAYESYLKYDTDGAAHRANMQNRMDISH